MKRYPPRETTNTKRPRPDSREDDDGDEQDVAASKDAASNACDGPFRPTLQRKAVDICKHGIDEDGFIKAEILMRWPGRPNIQAKAVEDGQLVKFDVAFLGPCLNHFKSIGLDLDFGDVFYLSLKGATLERKTTAPTDYLPMVIKYLDGVRVKFISRKRKQLPPGVVDYWASTYPTDVPLNDTSAFITQASESSDLVRACKKPKLGPFTGDAPFSSDWFATPVMPTSQDASANEGNTSTSQAIQPPPPPDTIPNTTSDEAFHSASGVRDDPAVRSPALPASPKAVTPPVQAAQPPPPKRLYRDVPGRPRRGDSAVQQKKATPPAQSSKESDKTSGESSPHDVADPLQKEQGKYASKKGAKKAAREARKAAKLAQQNAAAEPVDSEQAGTREPSLPPVIGQGAIPEPQPEAQTSTHTSSPHPPPAHASTSSVSLDVGRVRTPPRETRSIPPANPSTDTGSSAVHPSPPRPFATPRASQSNRPSSGLTPASQSSDLDLAAGCVGQQVSRETMTIRWLLIVAIGDSIYAP